MSSAAAKFFDSFLYEPVEGFAGPNYAPEQEPDEALAWVAAGCFAVKFV
jgi:hypothetical protein